MIFFIQGASGNAGPRVGCCKISDPVAMPAALTVDEDDDEYGYQNANSARTLSIGSIAAFLMLFFCM